MVESLLCPPLADNIAKYGWILSKQDKAAFCGLQLSVISVENTLWVLLLTCFSVSVVRRLHESKIMI